MKCKQRLCQRTKNVGSEGNCDVCQDVINVMNTKYAEIDAKKTVKPVQVDLKQMVKVHEQLSKGVKTDPQIVSVLVLGGIINITSQHDAIEELEVRIKQLEREEISTKTRIEAVENWVLTQSDSLRTLSEHVTQFDTTLVKLRKDHEKVTHEKGNVKKEVIKCKECDKNFERNCDFEKHIEEHKLQKEFECDICGKDFYLKWRLLKHKEMHSVTKKFCHYYNNGKPCPYEAIGCMFHHSKSGTCKQSICTNILCQFEHPKHMIEEEEAENVIENISDEEMAENDCHLCSAKFESLEPLCEHLQTEHVDYHQGVLRGLANIEA